MWQTAGCATQRLLQGRTCWPAVRTQAPAGTFFKVSLSSRAQAQSRAFPGAACTWQPCKVGVLRPSLSAWWGQLWQAMLTPEPPARLAAVLLVCIRAQLLHSTQPWPLNSFLLQILISNKHLTLQVLLLPEHFSHNTVKTKKPMLLYF